MNLIGQFGVGFYSVYLVSDYVEARSPSQLLARVRAKVGHGRAGCDEDWVQA